MAAAPSIKSTRYDTVTSERHPSAMNNALTTLVKFSVNSYRVLDTEFL